MDSFSEMQRVLSLRISDIFKFSVATTLPETNTVPTGRPSQKENSFSNPSVTGAMSVSERKGAITVVMVANSEQQLASCYIPHLHFTVPFEK